MSKARLIGRLQETWAVYEQYAMGADELRPLTLQGKTVFGDMGATLVDSLDTLWMMGLTKEFDRCGANPETLIINPKPKALLCLLPWPGTRASYCTAQGPNS